MRLPMIFAELNENFAMFSGEMIIVFSGYNFRQFLIIYDLEALSISIFICRQPSPDKNSHTFHPVARRGFFISCVRLT